MSKQNINPETPIYQVFTNLPGVDGAYTGKGTLRENYYFSFQRSQIDRKVLSSNLIHYSQALGFPISSVTWPNGSWPHSGQAVIAEENTWLPSLTTGGIVPFDQVPVTYDGIVTRSLEFVLGVQGADCPSVFLYDKEARVIGLAHSGWKPVVRGVIGNTLGLMTKMGASPGNILVFVGPGVGDRFNEFQWDEAMELHVRNVFIEAGRENLLNNHSLRYQMTPGDRRELEEGVGQKTRGGVSFKLNTLITRDLVAAGVDERNIEVSTHSTICERADGQDATFRYHSARRDNGRDPERPGFGSNLCVLFLTKLESESANSAMKVPLLYETR